MYSTSTSKEINDISYLQLHGFNDMKSHIVLCYGSPVLADDCAYGVDIVAVKDALDTFNQLDEAVEQLIRRIGLPINIPQVAEIWNQRDNFEKTFPNYVLAPSMFYVHPERGLFATLSVFKPTMPPKILETRSTIATGSEAASMSLISRPSLP